MALWVPEEVLCSGKLILSLRRAMPMVTRRRSTCSGKVPFAVTFVVSFAWAIAFTSGIAGSRPSSHLILSTLDDMADDIQISTVYAL